MTSTESLAPFCGEDGREAGFCFEFDGPSGRPAVVLEYGQQPDHRLNGPAKFIVARLQIGPVPALWAWVDDWWDQAAFVFPTHTESGAIVPPITAREAAKSPDWIRWFHRALLASSTGPLHPGHWWIGRVQDFPGRPPRAGVGIPSGAAWYDDFDGRIFPTRRVGPNDRRVGFWRKQLRAGARVPALLLHISLFGGYVVLDGHARLAAAEAEGLPLPLCVLAPYHTTAYAADSDRRESLLAQGDKIPWGKAQQRTIDGFNGALIHAFGEPRFHTFRTRAWPLRGGWAQWDREIRGHIARLPPDQAEHASELLTPATHTTSA